MTRKGKIARLPLHIRQKLNQRLQDGQKARQLVQWLNTLPEVQAVMASEFQGQPVLACNLSRWKSGGYQAWEQEQNTREATAALMEDVPALEKMAQAGLSNRMAVMFIANLLVDLKRLEFMREGPKKSRRQRELLDRFVALRRGDLEGERLRVERAKMDFRRRQQTGENKQIFHINDTTLAPGFSEVNCTKLH